MLLNEVLTRTEVKMRYEEGAREQQEGELVRIVTRNKPSGFEAARASVSAGLDLLAKRGSNAVRAALARPSQPNEDCC